VPVILSEAKDPVIAFIVRRSFIALRSAQDNTQKDSPSRSPKQEQSLKHSKDCPFASLPVTLNLFQDPFLLSIGGGPSRSLTSAKAKDSG